MQRETPPPEQKHWHAMPAEEVLAFHDSSPEGLTQGQVEQRLEQFGPNRLPRAEGSHVVLRFLRHFHNILIYVLLGSAVITGLLEHWLDTMVILAVVIANAIIGFIQEGKAEKAMDAIRHMLAPQAQVIRDRERLSVAGESLVPGDIVLLEAGDKVPADLRLLSAHGCSIQEAILTGESVPSEKSLHLTEQSSALGDRSNMAYSGTLIASGQATGVVVATGEQTEIGRISGLLSSVETLTTPLVSQMAVFASWLTFVILVAAGLLLAFGYYLGVHDFSEVFMAVVGLSVAAIPEGLPAVLSITLAIGVQAMAKRNAIVRRLPAIETLGAVSVICTDKTGTLTRNEMTVASVLTSRSLFSLDGLGYEPKGALKQDRSQVDPSQHAGIEELARAASLCNDAVLKVQDGVWRVEGDPMEGALLTFSGKMDFDARIEQQHWARTDAIPFDAKHRFMATLNHDHEGHACIFVKGAPERIMAMSQDQLDGDSCEPLDLDYWQSKSDEIAALGQRVLAFAVKKVPEQKTILDHADVESGLSFLGVVGMIDPPRSEALAAVAECHTAGIRVKMITGDHSQTAAAIGKKIGLANASQVLTGKEIDALDDHQLRQVVMECDIFARTSPEHKLRLVMALQSHGLTVAMTGDGVNDAPALKRADAGIAMGGKGSEAAKEAAALVLVDDNFASIVSAVKEGRTVYDNLKKVISWTLPTSTGEAMVIVLALLLGMVLPVTPIQILWINLITATTLGIALAFEPSEPDTMQRPPRARDEPLLNGHLVWHIVFVSILFMVGVFGIYHYAVAQAYSVDLARTMALNTLVIMEVFHLFFIRNFYSRVLNWKQVRGTPIVWLVVAIVALAQGLVTYWSPLQSVFATEAIHFADALLLLGIGCTLFVIIEAEKQVRLRLMA